MVKIALLVLVAFITGFQLNRMMTSSRSPEKSALCENLNEAKSDLISISQHEYIEYTKIKDLKQKYEKADELLGKVMLLFLADIGFRVEKMAPNELEVKSEVAENVAPHVAPHVAATRNDEPSSVTSSKDKQTARAQPLLENLGGKSSLIRNLNSRAAIGEALEKASIENPKVVAASGNPVEQKQMKLIEGSFKGEIKFFDKKRVERNVSWELVPNYKEKKVLTEFNLRMYGGGEGESESSGNGELRHVSMLAEDPYAYIVEACGGECYFQMYYNVIHDQFFGNYYETNIASKKFHRVGMINLRR